MKKTLLALGAVLTLTTVPAVVTYAQYVGPGSQARKGEAVGPLTNVADVLKRGRDDQRVTLTGNVVKKVGWEKYLFRDASGEIRIEIDDEAMPTQTFDEKTKVEITGEVEKDFMRSVEIDVKAMRLLP